MQPLHIHYLPIPLPFFIILVALFLLLLVMFLLDVLRYAYVAMGVAPRYVFILLVLSLLGSYVNIPVMHYPNEQIVSQQVIIFFGMRYVVPIVRDWPGTVIAVNVGGAIIPLFTSIYLLAKNRLYWRGLVGTAAVALICHQLAYPVHGLGIAIPVFVPPLVTAIVALILSRRYAAPLAYACGSLGILVGADLFNLDKVRGLGAPVVSIGGAGTFDGIFVTGLIAVLLASIVTRRANSERPNA